VDAFEKKVQGTQLRDLKKGKLRKSPREKPLRPLHSGILTLLEKDFFRGSLGQPKKKNI